MKLVLLNACNNKDVQYLNLNVFVVVILKHLLYHVDQIYAWHYYMTLHATTLVGKICCHYERILFFFFLASGTTQIAIEWFQ